MRKLAFWLALALIFTIPWENLVSFAGLGTVSRTLGFLAAAVWAVSVLVERRLRALRPFHALVLLFFLWNVASVFWSVHIDKTVTRFTTGLQLAGLVLMLWDLLDTKEALRAAMQVYVFGAYVSVGSTILNYLSGSSFYPSRYAATGFNVNDLGIILALGMPLAWQLAVARDSHGLYGSLRPVNLGYLVGALVAILFTASRTALLATGPVLLLMLGSLGQTRLVVRLLIVVVLTGALLAIQPLIPASSFERLGTVGSEVAEGDLNGRLAIWSDGIDSIMQHPLLGVGSGAFAEITDTGKVGHNFVLSLLVEVGMVGFLLFSGVLMIALGQIRRLPKQQAWMWLAVLAIWLLGALTHNLEYRKQTWLVLSLIVTSASLYAQPAALPRARMPYLGGVATRRL